MLEDDLRGQVLGDHFRLLEQLGEGGQSTVYRAADLSGGADVAVKVMKGSVAEDPNARERMSREAQVLMNLVRTPASIRLFGQYWTKDGRLCLAMELLDGHDLDHELGASGGTMDAHRLHRLLPPVIETLEAAHRQGVVHRDLKPGNLYLTKQAPHVRLLDFGFAKFMRLRSFTEDGFVAGSPSYIPPEAWAGLADLDARADVYSMAALMFRALTGEVPFPCSSLLDLHGKVQRAPRPKLTQRRPQLPKKLDAWAELALASNRDERFQNISALWKAFEEALS